MVDCPLTKLRHSCKGWKQSCKAYKSVKMKAKPSWRVCGIIWELLRKIGKQKGHPKVLSIPQQSLKLRIVTLEVGVGSTKDRRAE